MRIAIVVQGRFHGFDLAKGLLARGHEVVVFTNYPRWAARRFGLAPECVRSFVGHGVADRLISRIGGDVLHDWWEATGHRAFGRWAARALSQERWDVIHCWSGVSEEILASPAARHSLTLLMRGSSHVRTQRRLLDEERARVGIELDRPSDWIVERELREYERADRILVLSTFSARTFGDEGVPARRVRVLPLGVNVDTFAATRETIAKRVQRIISGDPLTVLFVGSLLFRKGLWDLALAARALDRRRFRFLLVGERVPETRDLTASLNGIAEATGSLPQSELPDAYARGDLFLFPTIEDGFPVVLAQARAARLPIITTLHGAGVDLIDEGRNGWIVPIRDAGAIVERLEWCERNRGALADMIKHAGEYRPMRSWADVAADFERICEESAQPSRRLQEISA
jgi:glycosyltransferase involved in cell wall biosynthesis